MVKLHRPEVLAPAGDRERLEAAVRFGADAVYLGAKEYGMRSAPQNFTMEELKSAAEYCHARDVKVYLTCNTLPTNKEAEGLEEFIREAAAAGVDALIVADIGALLCAKRTAPEIEVHISTQTGVVNYLTARELYNLGASRVVLAREVPLEEIKVIREKTPPELEIEAFVHGAMCVSFSGRCLLSNYLVHRDANRGECAQPCRWGYHLVEEKRPGQYFPIFEDEQGTHILNAKDLCMLPYLDQMLAAGVDSFKIEGRAKSAYYVAVVTNAYRCGVELLNEDPANYQVPQWLMEETQRVSHRAYSSGFYLSGQEAGQYYSCRGYVREWDVVAMVEEWQDGWLYCTTRNRFWAGDAVELMAPGGQPVPLEIAAMENEEGEPIEVSRHPMAKVRIKCPYEMPVGAIVRKMK